MRVTIQPSPPRKNASKRANFVRFLHVECSLSLQFNLFSAQENEPPADSRKQLEGFIGSGGSPTFGRALACFVFCGTTGGSNSGCVAKGATLMFLAVTIRIIRFCLFFFLAAVCCTAVCTW